MAEVFARMVELGRSIRRFFALDAVASEQLAVLPELSAIVRALTCALDDALEAFAGGNVLAAGRVVARCIETGRQFDRESASIIRALPEAWWDTLPGMEANTLGEVVDSLDDCVHGTRRLVDALVVAVLLARHAARIDYPAGSAGAAIAQSK